MSIRLLLDAPDAAQVLLTAGGLGAGRTVPTVAAVLGLISVVVGGLHTANSAGGLGTGNGLAGAVVAMALGLIGLVLGGLALALRRRAEAASGHES